MKYALLAGLAAIAVSACGGDGEDGGDDAAPTVSPQAESRLIVYEAHGSVPEDPNSTDIYTIDPETGETQRLTNDGSSRHPAWSPDHSRIVYASDAGETDAQEQIFIMNADGSGARRLTSTPGVSEWHPRISPDGSRIAYMSVGNDFAYVNVMNIDGSGEERVSERFQALRSGVWSPDGREIYFSGLKTDDDQFDIFSLDVETGELTLRIGTEHAEACPHLTDDGKTLMYGNAVEEENGEMNMDLFMHDLTSGDTSGKSDTRLTFAPGVDDYGDPNADGSTFAFISNRDDNGELYLIDRDGENERRLTRTAELREENPDW